MSTNDTDDDGERFATEITPEEMLSVELVLGADSDDPLRLPVISTALTDSEDELVVRFKDGGIDEFHQFLGLDTEGNA
ncbi:hypothetical protein [Halobaculum sp. D14]|uniref:hypothetical protein n=1 Tax=Halobaculum sp. D14 TaxID=3421642 RepID=UPI003EC1215E